MNKVVHFEIPVDNLERAKTFYRDTFGWNLIDIPEMGYVMVHTAKTDEKGMMQEVGAINGGMMQRSHDDGGEHPVIVINVPNLDEHIIKIEAAGGALVMPKMKVGDMGYYARMKDTEGNVIGIFQDLEQSSH